MIFFKSNAMRINGLILFFLIILESELGGDLIGHSHSLENMALHITGALVMIFFAVFNQMVSFFWSSRRNQIVSGVNLLATVGAATSGLIFVLYANKIALELMELYLTLIIVVCSILLILWGKDLNVSLGINPK